MRFFTIKKTTTGAAYRITAARIDVSHRPCMPEDVAKLASNGSR